MDVLPTIFHDVNTLQEYHHVTQVYEQLVQAHDVVKNFYDENYQAFEKSKLSASPMRGFLSALKKFYEKLEEIAIRIKAYHCL